MNPLILMRILLAALTGMLGLLGVIIETRDENTRTITRGGWVILLLITLSMTLGVSAELLESSQKEREKTEATMQTLALAKKSDQTLKEIQRALAPLGDLRLDLAFEIGGCKNNSRAFCRFVYRARQGEWVFLDPQSAEDFAVEVHIFRDPNMADKFLREGHQMGGDLVFIFDSVPANALSSHSKSTGGDLPTATVHSGLSDVARLDIHQAPVRNWLTNNGTIISVPDLHGCTLLWLAQERYVEDLMPTEFHLYTGSGQGISVSGFERLTNLSRQVFGDIQVFRAVIS